MPEATPPIDLLHWGAALLPLVVLLVLLVGLRWKAPEAGPVGLFLAAAIALLLFRTPWETLAVASGKGVWDAIFILYVVWPALILYRMADRAGAFVAIREGIERYSENQLFLVLALGWVFASFLQGIIGFGAPIAVVAPLLIAIGVRPVYAVVIPLIGHAWANLFGTLSVAWLATQQVVDLADVTATAFQSALLLWIPNLLGGVAIAWLFGRMAGVRHALPMILIISAIHGGVQAALVLWNPVLAGFLAGMVALIALYPLSRWKRYDQPADIEDPEAMEETREEGERKLHEHEEEEPEPVMSFGMALMPYAVLTVVTVGALVIAPVEAALEQLEVGMPFPTVETGYGITEEGEDPYAPITPLTHPGFFILLASLVGWLVYRSRGYYERWAERVDEPPTAFWGELASDGIPTSLAIVTFLVMSRMMDHSGQVDVLALGISSVAPPAVYAVAANGIGALGAFMTSSNTASNILLSPLQQTVAEVQELPEPTVLAAQNAGAAFGNAIAPANAVLGTGTAGIVGREGEVLRKTLPWVGIVAVLVGGATLLLLGLAG